MQDFFFLLKSTQNYFSLSAAVALLIVYKVENQYSIWQMRALWSRCQDSAVLSITQLCLWSEGSACLREGGPNLPPDLQLLFHRPTVLTPLTLCGSVSPPPSLSLSLTLSLPPRCTSAPTASSPTRTWIVSECTWWRSTQSSPCYAAHYARTCSTTRSTFSSTSHTSTVWLLTVWISLLPQ